MISVGRRARIIKIIEDYGAAVDCQGWEIPERLQAADEIVKLIEELLEDVI